MFGRSNDLKAIQQLEMGELDELLESIKEGKKSILKAETVEELIDIKKQVAHVLANKAGGMTKLEYIQQTIGDVKAEVDKQANQMVTAKNELISNQKPVEKHKDITHSTNEVNELVEGMGEQINTSVTSMSQIETVLKLIDDAIIEINSAAQAMKQQVSTLVAAAQNVAGNITGISSIAEQTNLLALNASIEAARAGEAGKGFAVVAEEIRKLSDGTKELLDNMTELLSKLQEASLKTDEQVETTTTGIQKVETKVKEVGGNVKDSKESTLALQEQIQKIGHCIMDIESEFSVSVTASNTPDLTFIDEAESKLKLMHQKLDDALTSTVDIIQSYNTTFNAIQKIKQSNILGQ